MRKASDQRTFEDMLEVALRYTGEVVFRRCERDGHVAYLVSLERDGWGSVEGTPFKALRNAAQGWEVRARPEQLPAAVRDDAGAQEAETRERKVTARLRPVPSKPPPASGGEGER